MSGPLHTVHVRVNDTATGQPTPVRLRCWGPTRGDYYPPLGRLDRLMPADISGGSVRLGDEVHAIIDGSCEVPLPAHPFTVEIHKGFEYRPLVREVSLGPGKLALRFSVKRWTDLRAERWYAGDPAAFLMTPPAALLEAAAEDVAIVHLLATEWRSPAREAGRSLPNIVAFSGQRPALEMPGHLVAVNTRNCGAWLGSLDLLHCHRAVYPLATGQDGVWDWTLDDWCDQCHRKAGLVLWAEFGRPWSERPGGPNEGFGGEALANLVLGKIDAVSMDRLDWHSRLQREEWYRLLNCGLRVPLAGGSGKCSNTSVLGGLRTYARLLPGEEFSSKSWIETVRAGRTFVTNGPLLSFTVNEQDPGARIDLPLDARRVRLRAEARSIVPFERLELVLNGEPVAGVEASGDPVSALLEGEFEVPGSCWLAARCWGADAVAAHTSPIWVRVPGQLVPVDMISLALLIERLDKMLSWVEKDARFDGERTRNHLTETLQAARAALVQRAPA